MFRSSFPDVAQKMRLERDNVRIGAVDYGLNWAGNATLGVFDSILLMGHNFGLHRSAEKGVAYLPVSTSSLHGGEDHRRNRRPVRYYRS